ncbi:single-stranded DNA-binding protein [Sporosarcina sp. BP05]|uniref:single-stranded DNA-binding protein n=1 Tax=Sporosarcina sp. BP05 TaxID=2758726 RepID=UPI001646D240|nr:single-stranded DNA-binding protein [Sporosarcina sp. BP05]
MFLQSDNLFTARGRLAKNPVINISDSGNVVTTITLAQKTPFKTEKNEYKTVFIEYVAVDTKNSSTATRLAEFNTKGSLVTLEGYHDSFSKKGEYVQVNRISAFRNEEGKEKTEQRRNEQK